MRELRLRHLPLITPPSRFVISFRFRNREVSLELQVLVFVTMFTLTRLMGVVDKRECLVYEDRRSCHTTLFISISESLSDSVNFH